ncbi:MAG: DEAD/DEAH box helicase [Bdellovibrionaceae bacterium]|nr:DEAD/DEAH box helicase [Pseudobdellovibrionaceae bacterium]
MYELRPYQHDAVQATLRHFRQEKTPAVIVLPTGAGKSLVIAELARLARGRVLVLAHVRELVEQNHAKYLSFGLDAGIYSAGLGRKDQNQKVIFGSIQSIARAQDEFFREFSLLIIDECHRVSDEGETQYQQVITQLQATNPELCVLGLTATPYRLGLGWIYEYNSARKELKTTQPRFFKKCIFELSIQTMIDDGFLTPPVRIDSPVASYDFSALELKGGRFVISEIEKTLKDQKRITPLIIRNIVEMAEDRQGVMIFTSSVRHATEIMASLPPFVSALVVGETSSQDREDTIQAFKERKLKFLVNVSVLTTGFDAPHVDVIAILRPTESVSLYQQIVGRGLRLSPGKQDCLILDYTGQTHDVFSPEVGNARPNSQAVMVKVDCPACGHENDFWGLKDDEGQIVEHYGRKCQGAFEDPVTGEIAACGFRFRFKVCGECGAENDIAARVCHECAQTLVDADQRLKEVMSLKDAHIMRVDSMAFHEIVDKKGRHRLEVDYYDADGEVLKEFFDLATREEIKAFELNFLRVHHRVPGLRPDVRGIRDVLGLRSRLRQPAFLVARKHRQDWKIREKIFGDVSPDGRTRRNLELYPGAGLKEEP